MRHRDNIDGIPYLPANEVTNNNNITSFDSKFGHQTSSTAGSDVRVVYWELQFASARFRRIRDDILDNLKMNFRRLEDVFNDWNKECVEMRENDLKAKYSNPILRKKIKKFLDGLKEIEELGRKANIKLSTVV